MDEKKGCGCGLLFLGLVIVGVILKAFEVVTGFLGNVFGAVTSGATWLFKAIISSAIWLFALIIKVIIVIAIAEVISLVTKRIGIRCLAKKNKVKPKIISDYLKNKYYSDEDAYYVDLIIPFKIFNVVIKLLNKNDIIDYCIEINIEKVEEVISIDKQNELVHCREIIIKLRSEKYSYISEMLNGNKYEDVYYNVSEVLAKLCSNYDIDNSIDEINEIIDETYNSFCEFNDIIINMQKESQDLELNSIKDTVCDNLSKLQSFNKILK